MLPKYHILLGAVFSAILCIFFNLSLTNSTIVFFSSFLIDADHYIFYVWKERDINLVNAYHWFKTKNKVYSSFPKKERKNYRHAFCFFHGIEPLLIIYALSHLPLMYWLFFVFVGFSFHLLLDVIKTVSEGGDFFSIVSLTYKQIKDSGRKPINF
jgi:hypothetical protein